MARLNVDVSVGNLNGGAPAVISTVVDSTADHSMLPASLLHDLGIAPKRRLAFILADGSVREYGYGFAILEIEGDEAPCPVLFGPEGVHTLGGSALAAFNLEENPGGDGLAPAKWMSLGNAVYGGGETNTTTVRAIAVSPMDGYRIWLRYSDGVSGEVDLSDFAGRGVFSAWNDQSVFESVRLDEYGAVAWGDDIDLCADALYARLTGHAGVHPMQAETAEMSKSA